MPFRAGLEEGAKVPEFHSVVVPMYCEEEVAEEFLRHLVGVLSEIPSFEIIVVDDGSTDRTYSILADFAERDERVKVIRLARNFGHQAAISAGIHYATGDTVTVIDADFQDPPELIPQMIDAWRDGAEIVYAVRTARAGETRFKRVTARLYYRLLSALSKTTAPVDSGDFRLMSRRAADAFRAMGERNRYVRGMVGWIGMRDARVYFERKERAAGETKYPLRRMIGLAVDGILSSSIVPLRIAIWLGLASALLGFGIAVWAFAQRVTGGHVLPGWTSIMDAILFVGGVQLMMLGVLGEYVGRIYDEVRQRPLYLIDQMVGIGEPTQGCGASTVGSRGGHP